MSDEQQWFTNDEVAKRYRTTVATVRHWRLMGHGPRGIKHGTRVLYPRSEILRFDKELEDQIDRQAANA